MKRMFVFIMCCSMLTGACMLTGCESNGAVTPIEVDDTIEVDGISGYTVNKIDDENIYIFTDPDTGVQYLVYREHRYRAGMGGITPRLNPDGSLCVVDTESEK